MTEHRSSPEHDYPPAPVRIVLVDTTHPGNIGAAARAMKTMGVEELCLIRPRRFPDPEATARAAGADDLLEAARVVDTLEEAIGDCTYVVGASARLRGLAMPLYDAREAAVRLVAEAPSGPVAVLFGTESSGLSNEEMDRCQAALTIPANPGFASLNLAAAVQVVCYELRMALGARLDTPVRDHPLATAAELERFFEHLQRVLVASGFLRPDHPKKLMRRLRRLYTRATPDQNEINILRGMLSSVEPPDQRRTEPGHGPEKT